MIINICPFCSKPLKKDMKFYGHPKFYQILYEMATLHSKKNFQYATVSNPLGNFTRAGSMCSKILKPTNKALAICLAYMSKQVDAVMEIVGEDKKDTIEQLEDKLKDIAVYSTIAVILIKEEKNENK